MANKNPFKSPTYLRKYENHMFLKVESNIYRFLAISMGSLILVSLRDTFYTKDSKIDHRNNLPKPHKTAETFEILSCVPLIRANV